MHEIKAVLVLGTCSAHKRSGRISNPARGDARLIIACCLLSVFVVHDDDDDDDDDDDRNNVLPVLTEV
jgi:hypothetical protein